MCSPRSHANQAGMRCDAMRCDGTPARHATRDARVHPCPCAQPRCRPRPRPSSRLPSLLSCAPPARKLLRLRNKLDKIAMDRRYARGWGWGGDDDVLRLTPSVVVVAWTCAVRGWRACVYVSISCTACPCACVVLLLLLCCFCFCVVGSTDAFHTPSHTSSAAETGDGSHHGVATSHHRTVSGTTHKTAHHMERSKHHGTNEGQLGWASCHVMPFDVM